MNNTTARRWDRSTLGEPELPLFSPANRTDSSQAGAKRIEPVRQFQYQRVLARLRLAADGLTNEQVQEQLGMPCNVETRAMRDLVKLGLARDSGQRRKSSHDISCIVWIPTT